MREDVSKTLQELSPIFDDAAVLDYDQMIERIKVHDWKTSQLSIDYENARGDLCAKISSQDYGFIEFSDFSLRVTQSLNPMPGLVQTYVSSELKEYDGGFGHHHVSVMEELKLPENREEQTRLHRFSGDLIRFYAGYRGIDYNKRKALFDSLWQLEPEAMRAFIECQKYVLESYNDRPEGYVLSPELDFRGENIMLRGDSNHIVFIDLFIDIDIDEYIKNAGPCFDLRIIEALNIMGLDVSPIFTKGGVIRFQGPYPQSTQA